MIRRTMTWTSRAKRASIFLSICVLLTVSMIPPELDRGATEAAATYTFDVATRDMAKMYATVNAIHRPPGGRDESQGHIGVVIPVPAGFGPGALDPVPASACAPAPAGGGCYTAPAGGGAWNRIGKLTADLVERIGNAPAAGGAYAELAAGFAGDLCGLGGRAVLGDRCGADGFVEGVRLSAGALEGVDLTITSGDPDLIDFAYDGADVTIMRQPRGRDGCAVPDVRGRPGDARYRPRRRRPRSRRNARSGAAARRAGRARRRTRSRRAAALNA